jgi:hypothetical protein
MTVGTPSASTTRTAELRALLAGGDRRSIARSRDALAAVLARPERIAEVAALAEDDDWLVSMRALDLLEKVAHAHADWVQPHRRLFLGALADSDQWEVRLQIVRALPLMSFTPGERRRAVDILRRDADHPQKFVRAWALDGLATFAQHDPALMPAVELHLRELERSGSKALATRARHIRARLSPERKPVWSCPKCGARLVTRNLWHSCGRFTLEALFARSAPGVLPLARRFIRLVRSLGDVQVIPQKTRLVFVARVRFAGLTPRKDGFVAAFALDREVTSPRIVKHESFGPRWQAHHVRIASPADLDDELREWLRESLEVVGMQAHLGRGGRQK